MRTTILAGFLLLAATATAWAGEVSHTSYSETTSGFLWSFTWTGHAPGVSETFASPGVAWTVTGSLTDLGVGDPIPDLDTDKDDLILLATHVSGPHGESDKPTTTLFLQNLGDLGDTGGAIADFPAASFTARGAGVHSNGDEDSYSLFYATTGKPAAGRPVTFTVSGTHKGGTGIPEPGTLSLLALGAVLAWKKRTSHQL